MSAPAVVMAMLHRNKKPLPSPILNAPSSVPSVEAIKTSFEEKPNLHFQIAPDTGIPIITGNPHSAADCRYIFTNRYSVCSKAENGGEGVCLTTMSEYVFHLPLHMYLSIFS